jgi:hypothetical protein
MKNFFKVILVLSGLSLVACNGFKSDPFAAKDDAIKNAKEALPKPVRPTAISSDVVSLDVTKNIAAGELSPMMLELRLKSLLNGYSYTYEIQNIDLFPGATLVKKTELFPNDQTIDPNTLVLTWTPKSGIVPSNLSYTELIMNIVITAIPAETNADQVLLQATHNLTFLVEPVMGLLESTFDQGVILIADQSNVVPFVILDNKHKSLLKLISQNNFPQGATISCEETNYSLLECQLVWTPTADLVGQKFTSSLEVQMKSLNPLSTQTVQKTVSLKYNVKAKQ